MSRLLILSSISSRNGIVTLAVPGRWHSDSGLRLEGAIPGGSGIHGLSSEQAFSGLR
jgi:hypothetical protein